MPRKHICGTQIENNMFDFEGTLRLALDSVDVADWKESYYRSGPARLPEQTGFWDEIISRRINKGKKW